jgi:hypothetical protein
MASALQVGERSLRQVSVSWAALKQAAPASRSSLWLVRSKRNGVMRTNFAAEAVAIAVGREA